MSAATHTMATNRTGGEIRLRCLLARSLVLPLVAGASANAFAVPTCTVASGATLSFGSVAALASTGIVTTNTGGSFWINCTNDVTTTPALYSATTRTLVSGANTLPFRLSAVSAGGADLPIAPGGAPLGIAKNGSNQTVTLHGTISAADFKALPSGVYSGTIALTLEY